MATDQTPDWAQQMIKKLNQLGRSMEVQNRLAAFANLGPERIADINHQGDPFQMYLPYGDMDYIQRHIIRTRDFYETDLLSQFRALGLVAKGGVIIDAGANIGNHTVFFNHYFAPKRMYCFEPQKAVFKILSRNIDLNGDGADIRPMNTLLGAQKGSGKMAAYKQGNHGAATFTNAEDGDTPMIALDDAVLKSDLKKVSFIKIDVEGFQDDVLRGADAILTQSKPLLWIEVMDAERDATNALLSEYGYVPTELSRNNILYQAA